MDAGVISWLKRKYRYSMLEKFIDILDGANNYTEKRFEGRGREGIIEGKMAHIIDAKQQLKKSWDELDARTIASC